jgi:hypothetical protein
MARPISGGWRQAVGRRLKRLYWNRQRRSSRSTPTDLRVVRRPAPAAFDSAKQWSKPHVARSASSVSHVVRTPASVIDWNAGRPTDPALVDLWDSYFATYRSAQ